MSHSVNRRRPSPSFSRVPVDVFRQYISPHLDAEECQNLLTVLPDLRQHFHMAAIHRAFPFVYKLPFRLMLGSVQVTTRHILLCSDRGEGYDLPSGLETLCFFSASDEKFPKIDREERMMRDARRYLPASLKSLTLTDSFDQPLDNLPSSLTSLTLYHCPFNPSVDSLPASLRSLSLLSFNQPIDSLPASLSGLRLGMDFNQPIDHLPASQIGSADWGAFNRKIDHLPAGLQSLCLGGEFNQPVDHLPLSLTSLSLGNRFNRPIDKLPPSLTSLKLIGYAFDHPLKLRCIPASLTSLEISESYEYTLDHLPASITVSHPDFY